MHAILLEIKKLMKLLLFIWKRALSIPFHIAILKNCSQLAGSGAYAVLSYLLDGAVSYVNNSNIIRCSRSDSEHTFFYIEKINWPQAGNIFIYSRSLRFIDCQTSNPIGVYGNVSSSQTDILFYSPLNIQSSLISVFDVDLLDKIYTIDYSPRNPDLYWNYSCFFTRSNQFSISNSYSHTESYQNSQIYSYSLLFAQTGRFNCSSIFILENRPDSHLSTILVAILAIIGLISLAAVMVFFILRKLRRNEMESSNESPIESINTNPDLNDEVVFKGLL